MIVIYYDYAAETFETLQLSLVVRTIERIMQWHSSLLETIGWNKYEIN